MPTRQAKLLKRTNAAAPALLESGGIIKITAAYKWQFKLHLRDGYHIQSDTNTRFVVTRDGETVEMWIDADPIISRSIP